VWWKVVRGFKLDWKEKNENRLKDLQVWGREVSAAQFHHVMLAMSIDINCLSGKPFLKTKCSKREGRTAQAV
jgi:hypothetical protein